MRWFFRALVAAAALALLWTQSVYTVERGELGLVRRPGAGTAEIVGPGRHLKAPLVDHVVTYQDFDLGELASRLASADEDEGLDGRRIAVRATYGARVAETCFRAWNHEVEALDFFHGAPDFIACTEDVEQLDALAEPCPNVSLLEELSDRCLVAILGRAQLTAEEDACAVTLMFDASLFGEVEGDAGEMYPRCLVVEHVEIVDPRSDLLEERAVGFIDDVAAAWQALVGEEAPPARPAK